MQSVMTETRDAREFTVQELLEDHDAAVHMVNHLGRLPLSRTLKIIIWSLRIYVLFMVTVVIINAVELVH